MVVVVTGFKQPVQMNDFATFDLLPFIPLHILCKCGGTSASRDENGQVDVWR